MSNETKLGTIPNGDEGRDAVHIAIAPVQAAQEIRIGELVNAMKAQPKSEVWKCNACGKIYATEAEAAGCCCPMHSHARTKLSPEQAMREFHAMKEKYVIFTDPPEDEYEERQRKQFCLSCGATHYKEICPECGSDAQDDL